MVYTEKRDIRTCFWIFFFLLMTEGIFRRWLFPSLNNIFLVARDPFVLYSIYLGIRAGLLRDIPAIIMFVLAFLCFFSALFFGHGNIYVALYGMRILLYYPFIYICARVLTRDDILKVGRVFVLLITPMTLLCMVQFVSPQSSFVNIGVGGDETGAGFSGGALGYYRPPGIFTFIAALTDYYGISLSFLLYFLTNNRDAKRLSISRTILFLSVIFYIISIPVSISRTHFVQTIIICLGYLLFVNNDIKTIKRITFIIILVTLSIVLILYFVPDIDLYTKVFLTRFNGANTSEGGLLSSAYERSFGWATRAIEKTSIMGYGDGYFTNVGMKILRGDTGAWGGDLTKIADATEMEWGRVICEDGLLLGMCILAVRFIISGYLFVKSKFCLTEYNDYLPWTLLPFAIYLQVFGQLKAPYHLGFCSIITISCLTVLISDERKNKIRQLFKLILRKTKVTHNENINLSHNRQ